MKRILQWCSAALLVLALTPLIGCDSNGDRDQDRDRIVDVDADGYTTFDLAALGAWLDAMPTEDLATAETAAILYAREEEKMARDAFRVFDQQYAPDALTRIAASEQTHMDAIRLLIEKYGLTDPVTDDAVGTFTDETIRALYDAFVDQGAGSLVEALEAGAAIQELSIADLEDGLRSVDNTDVACVFENLQKGSRNHLRRLVDLLGDRDVTYAPLYLSQDAFDAIIESAMEQGTAC